MTNNIHRKQLICLSIHALIFFKPCQYTGPFSAVDKYNDKSTLSNSSPVYLYTMVYFISNNANSCAYVMSYFGVISNIYAVFIDK